MSAPPEADVARQQLAAAMVRIAAGDRGALRLLYRDTASKLFGVCLRILKDNAEAEDVLQEVYITVWRSAGTFVPERASPITWLVAIARNRAIDRLRAVSKIRRVQPIEDEALEVRDKLPDPLEQFEGLERHQRLMACLGELDPSHAGAIRSAFLDGATYDELAKRMDVPLGTMKSWVRRGLLRLKECLER